MGERSDAELPMASRDDLAAFAEMYERSSDEILAYFYRRTWDPHVSADLVAETFAAAWLRRGTYRGRDGSPVPWLFGIAKRELGRYRRRRKIEFRAVRRLGIQVPQLGNDSVERIEQMVDARAFRGELVAALKRLSASERDAVQLRVIDDRSFREVGERLGCSEGAARVRVHRALRKLADAVEAPA
ncbi:MAG: RNA polymerase sigma factor [Acidimicrobiia bacterium]|nr:RNA polymerase sigma factor [Acidimicrobiia bacterium]